MRPLIRISTSCLRCRWASTAAAAARETAPMLLKMRKDMVAALKAKDTNRLNVIRAILADATNASKTPHPITTDLQLRALLRRKAAAARDAAEQFRAAARPELGAAEAAQAAVLDEYAGQVAVVGEDEVRAAVRRAVAELQEEEKKKEKEDDGGARAKVDVGSVRRALLGEGGALAGRPVEMGLLVQVVKEVLGAGEQ